MSVLISLKSLTSIFDRLYGSERSLRFLTAPFDRGFGLRCRPSTWRGCIFRRPFGHFLVVFRSQSLAVVIFAHRVFIWAGGYPPRHPRIIRNTTARPHCRLRYPPMRTRLPVYHSFFLLKRVVAVVRRLIVSALAVSDSSAAVSVWAGRSNSTALAAVLVQIRLSVLRKLPARVRYPLF